MLLASWRLKAETSCFNLKLVMGACCACLTRRFNVKYGQKKWHIIPLLVVFFRFMHTPQIYLASTSPRRRDLLDQLGIRYRALAIEVDEMQRANELPDAYVIRLARAKAGAGWQAVAPHGTGETRPVAIPHGTWASAVQGCTSAARGRMPKAACPVLGADTSVVLDGAVLGKPRDRAHGLEMLEQLSGRSHQVLTAIALVDGVREAMRLSVSTVVFRATTAAERDAYWETGEPLGKAGGYAVQGRAAIFIAHLAGSFSGVMGLPLYETAQVLNEFGVAVLDQAGMD